MVSLEDLVPDVLYLILLNASSLQALWSFIRASPCMYSVFRNQRDVILATIITREIGGGIIADAQFALRSSYFSPRGLSKPDALAWLAEYEAGLERNTYSSKLLLSTEALPMCRLHQDVKFFADLFAHDKLRMVSSEIPEDSSPDLCQLSITERTRIYRAIYRYAIYGNLFYYNYNDHRLGAGTFEFMSAQEQSHSFLALFPAWQVEELSCINDFIFDKIMEKWKEVEDDFFFSCVDDRSKCWDLGLEDIPYTPWEEYADIFFSHTSKVFHSDWQQYFATLSLPELRKIFTAKSEPLRELVLNHAYNRPRDFLSEALAEEPPHAILNTPEYVKHKEARVHRVKLKFNKDSIDQPNEGWLWDCGFQSWELYTVGSLRFPSGEGLRRFGYVFWDSERLHATGILENDVGDVARDMLRMFPRPPFNTHSVEDMIYKVRLYKIVTPEVEAVYAQLAQHPKCFHAGPKYQIFAAGDYARTLPRAIYLSCEEFNLSTISPISTAPLSYVTSTLSGVSYPSKNFNIKLLFLVDKVQAYSS